MDDALLRGLITQFNLTDYAEEELFFDFRIAMKELLAHITATGELDRHWRDKQKVNELTKRTARKEARDRRRLEQGDKYNSENESSMSDSKESSDSDYDSENPSDYYSEEDISEKSRNLPSNLNLADHCTPIAEVEEQVGSPECFEKTSFGQSKPNTAESQQRPPNG